MSDDLLLPFTLRMIDDWQGFKPGYYFTFEDVIDEEASWFGPFPDKETAKDAVNERVQAMAADIVRSALNLKE